MFQNSDKSKDVNNEELGVQIQNSSRSKHKRPFQEESFSFSRFKIGSSTTATTIATSTPASTHQKISRNIARINEFTDEDFSEFVDEIFQRRDNDNQEKASSRSNSERDIQEETLSLVEQVFEDVNIEHTDDDLNKVFAEIFQEVDDHLEEDFIVEQMFLDDTLSHLIEHVFNDEAIEEVNGNIKRDNKSRKLDSKYALTSEPKSILDFQADLNIDEVDDQKSSSLFDKIATVDNSTEATLENVNEGRTLKLRFPSRIPFLNYLRKKKEAVDEKADHSRDSSNKILSERFKLKDEKDKISQKFQRKATETSSESTFQFEENTIPTIRRETTKSSINSKNVRTNVFKNIFKNSLSPTSSDDNKEARETLKVGIDMESEDAKVMFVMKSKTKQMTVDKDQLVPALQILMDTLSILEKEEVHS